MLERIFSICVLLLAGGYLLLASQYVSEFSYEPLGANGFPYIIGIAIALSMVYLIIKSSNLPKVFTADEVKRSAILVGATIVYGLIFEPLGFILSTGIVGTAISLYLGQNMRSAVLFNWVGGTAIYVLLVHVLDLNLPAMPFTGI